MSAASIAATSPPRPRSGMFHSSTTSILTFLIVAAVATCMYANFWFLNHDVPIIPLALALEQTAINGEPAPTLKLMSYRELDTLTNNELLGPDEFGSGCPKSCGCPSTRIDCPRHYKISAVNRSANALLDKEAIRYYETKQEMSHMLAAQHCIKGRGLETGGWCLGNLASSPRNLNLQDGRRIKMPREQHVAASQNIVEVLVGLFTTENVTSVSDYGAGVGQYGAELKTRMPRLVYYGYDGAGDVEAYTSGFLRWFDLTQPLNNPVTDWVLSLEVGEHIPSKYEGMFIRNLHRHNCKGIILSWGILGQTGHNHINNHSNDYLNAVFVELGYMRDSELETLLRRKEGNYRWFEKSVMVFRREQPVC
eukprot:scaffold1921_cov140-Skeletonema_marinoi.AAC.3